MKLTMKFKNGLKQTLETSSLKTIKKNPCLGCRPDGGCYDHSCFMPEDWGDFLILEKGNTIRIQDTETIMIKEF